MRLATTLLLAAFTLTAQAADKLPVASLSTVLADIASNVGGDRVDITEIVRPGVDPHEFEPTPGDLKAINSARVVLASGLGFEGYLDKLRSSIGQGATFVIVGNSIQPILITGEDEHGHSHSAGEKFPDPHWWHSIANVKIATRVIRDALIAADPADKDAFSANASAYLAKLDDLSRWAKLQIAKLPANKRVLVTSHDALGYFARDYHFEIRPVQGISTTDQPSSQKVKDLITAIQAEGVKAIFAENIENPKVLIEITRETGATLGGTLYADGLGDKEATTYDSMMRHNITTIVEALQ